LYKIYPLTEEGLEEQTNEGNRGAFMRKCDAALLIIFTALAHPVLAAEDVPSAQTEHLAVGLEIDLLPTVLSAIAGEFGGAANVWVGFDRLRFRAVGGHLAFPSGFLMPAGFNSRELTTAAAIVDYFFFPKFSGPWIGTGFEYWWNTVGSPAGSDKATWNSAVYTLGGGFVWKFWGNVYLNPWLAGHLLLSRPEVALYGTTWKPAPLSFEVSLKIGGFVWL